MRVCGSGSAGGSLTNFVYFVVTNWRPPRWGASLFCLLVPVSTGWLGGCDEVPGFSIASDHGGSDGGGRLVGVSMCFETKREYMERPEKCLLFKNIKLEKPRTGSKSSTHACDLRAWRPGEEFEARFEYSRPPLTLQL